jgi:hypothetical protein
MLPADEQFERNTPRVVRYFRGPALTVRVSQKPPMAFRAERTLTCIFGSVFF